MAPSPKYATATPPVVFFSASAAPVAAGHLGAAHRDLHAAGSGAAEHSLKKDHRADAGRGACEAVLRREAACRPHGRSRRRIFDPARPQQPAVGVRIVLPALDTEYVQPAALYAGRAEHRVDLRAVEDRRVHGLPRRQRHDEEGGARVHLLRGRAPVDRRRVETHSGRQRRGIGDGLPERRRLLRHPGERQLAVLDQHHHGGCRRRL